MSKTAELLKPVKPFSTIARALIPFLQESMMRQPEKTLSDLRWQLIQALFLVVTKPSCPETVYKNLFQQKFPSGLSDILPRLAWVRDIFQLTTRDLGTVYEMLLCFDPASLPTKQTASANNHIKRRSGSFFTPSSVALAMAKTLLYYLPNPSTSRVLDPAVGSGVFLQALYDEGCSLNACYGMDLDPVAVDVARLILWNQVGQPGLFQAFLSETLVCEDALLTAFPRCFDGVIGNPPYLSVKQGIDLERRRQYEALYVSATGQYDLYTLFIERGLTLLQKEGVLVYLLPKPLLINDHQKSIRENLLQYRLLEIWDIGKEVFSPKASVESVVLVVQKTTPSSAHNVIHKTWQHGQAVPMGPVRQEDLGFFCEKAFNLWLIPENMDFLRAVDRVSQPLGEWVIQPSGRGIELGKNHCRRTLRQGFQPVLTGQDVFPFYLPEYPGFYIGYDPSDAKYFKAEALYKSPKLVIRRVADRPMAAVDLDQNWLTLNTLYNIHLKDPNLLPVVCVLLNSDWMKRWFTERFYFNEVLFPYLRQQQLMTLPMPSDNRLLDSVPPNLSCLTGGVPCQGTFQDVFIRLHHDILLEKPGSLSAVSRKKGLEQLIEQLFSF